MIIFLRIILFVVGSVLLANGGYLLALKKIHLGIILPFLIGLIFIVLSVAWHPIQNYLKAHPTAKKLWNLAWCGFIVWALSLTGFFWKISQNLEHTSKPQDYKAIIVLGSGTINGQPTPILASRLDTAAQLAQQYPQAKLVLTGGMDFNEHESEAEVMANYLQKTYQFNKANFILENKSTSTALNLENSAPLMQQQQITKQDKIAIVTSDFHTLRAQAIAKKQNFSDVTMVSAPTPKLTRYNAWVREYFAFISGKLLKEY